MTVKEAIICLEGLAIDMADGIAGLSETSPMNDVLARRIEAISLAQDALRAQQERENQKPLTIAELLEMDGEPVWLHTFSSVQKKTNIEQWAILESVGAATAVFLRGGCNSRLTKLLANYGVTWLVYRHKLKGESK